MGFAVARMIAKKDVSIRFISLPPRVFLLIINDEMRKGNICRIVTFTDKITDILFRVEGAENILIILYIADEQVSETKYSSVWQENILEVLPVVKR